jgi:riboflavin synthase
LIEEKGRIKEIGEGSLVVKAEKVLDGLRVGDSISVNGVCLTVVDTETISFRVDVMAETLRTTNLGRLKPGDAVNLERATVLGERLGGHLLTGHVDGVGRVVGISKEEGGWSIEFEVPKELTKYMVLKGSVGVDGVSLTIGRLLEGGFTVFIIPHTLKVTTIGEMEIGYLANIEVDMIAKYVERILKKEKSGITLEFLKEHGFWTEGPAK